MTTVITADDVIAFAPEYAETAPSRIELFIEFAPDYVNEGQFGRKTKQALLLVTCHLMAMADQGSELDIVSEKVGDLSVNYAAANSGDEWDNTSYGTQFKALKRTIKKTPLVV